jgi:hypothetical protein
MYLLRTDGTVVRTNQDVPAPDKGEELTDLAVAPDGTHMVVSYGSKVFFMDAEGKVIQTWPATTAPTTQPSLEEYLVQPTFTPDSKLVAFKYLAKDEDYVRTVAIVFFTPEGKEVSRAAIPRIKPGTTRPASQPATSQPASAPTED